MLHLSPEIQSDREDLATLAERAGIALLDVPAIAAGNLDDAAFELRRAWLARAHHPGDATLKSPCEGEVSRLPDGKRIHFGYERELSARLLESRAPLCYPVPPGWQSLRVLCRSGQAALSCLLHHVAHTASALPLTLHHAGRYFETAALLDLWPRQVFALSDGSPSHVDVLIGEPVHCDGQFGLSIPTRLPRAFQALLLDTTMVGLQVDIAPWLERFEGSFAAIFRSGLKLDQAGLELANVGIVQLFVRDGAKMNLAATAAALQRIRALTGGGLTLDEMAALSAPWFLDRDYLQHYTAQLFANNAALAQVVGSGSHLFDERCHPSLLSREAVAPFCAIRLRRGDAAAHRRLLHHVEEEITRRSLALANGGSFGFRGNRYELIEPEPSAGEPFLRVAMGFRGGSERDRIIELFRELAALPALP
ncbi:MAG: hypothetical protein EPO10_30355 [Reyranella sp.]|uniref:hypothetical protein n=1 Tax=Reyranella sp. TaxID=1929291 RepID=UPI001200893F|nr:hypothetical protein [Reyranella sp.]TAJ95815.1 MAG: hypothetical protein EPO41_08370 [Reyranella sp.]TBR21152.1 MAG: hypothetical protein EPO10_30355 [Reyranella sp.]